VGSKLPSVSANVLTFFEWCGESKLYEYWHENARQVKRFSHWFMATITAELVSVLCALSQGLAGPITFMHS